MPSNTIRFDVDRQPVKHNPFAQANAKAAILSHRARGGQRLSGRDPDADGRANFASLTLVQRRNDPCFQFCVKTAHTGTR
jgi:hypothetical protein